MKMAKNIWDEFDKAIDTKGLAEDVKDAAENGGTLREVPESTYEVTVEKLELVKSKSGQPMVTCWMKIISGEFKNSRLFFNQVVAQGFQVHRCNEFLRALVAELDDEDAIEIEFKTYRQYGELLMDVAEAIDGNFEYAVEYSKNDKGYPNYEVKEVFVLE